MHSSISSSDTTEFHGFKQWLLSLCLLGCLLLFSELFWRDKEFEPLVKDSQILWSSLRNQVYGEKKIVVLGASRAYLGLDLKVLRQEFPEYDIVQLSSAGRNPNYTLKDLVDDPEFTGIILCSMRSDWLLPRNHKGQKRLVDFYRKQFFSLSNLQRRLKTSIEAFLQGSLVTLSPELRLALLLKTDFNPSPKPLYRGPDRSARTYYSKMPPWVLKRLRKRKYKIEIKPRQPTSSYQAANFERVARQDLKGLNAKLRKRGGRIVFLRFPTSGKYWESDERCFPKKRFWDKIGKWSTVPTIHFKDYPELDQFECPDTSHLDANDAPVFTKHLVHIIKQKIPGLE